MNKIFKISLIMIALIAAILLFMGMPWFFISEINITGNSRLTEEYIRQTMEIRDEEAVFFWNSLGAKRRLMENNYVDRVTIDIDYLSRIVTVEVRERILSGYVEYINGIYLYIDENGRVLDSATYFTESLPIVVGLEFSKFTVGELLDVTNPASFELVVTLAKLFNKYEMEADVIKVDVSEINDIHLFIGNIDVELGGIENADEKIRTVREIVDNHITDKEMRGFLTIKDINKPARFRPLQ